MNKNASKKVAGKDTVKKVSKTAIALKIDQIKKLTYTQKLEAMGIDEICELISSGKSQRQIADELSINPAHFSKWLAADVQRSARAREARVLSAAHWDLQAERVLIDSDETLPGSIAKARELASHYRWRAKSYDKNQYGDKISTELSGSLDIQVTRIERVVIPIKK